MVAALGFDGKAHAGQPLQAAVVFQSCGAARCAAQRQPMQGGPATCLEVGFVIHGRGLAGSAAGHTYPAAGYYSDSSIVTATAAMADRRTVPSSTSAISPAEM